MLHWPIDAPVASLTTRPPSHPLQSPCDFYLAARPESVAWGYLDAKRPPALVVSSGATVAIDTVNGAAARHRTGVLWDARLDGIPRVASRCNSRARQAAPSACRATPAARTTRRPSSPPSRDALWK